MGYGATKGWQNGSGRARAAGSSSARKGSKAKRRKSRTARSAPKKSKPRKKSSSSRAVKRSSARSTSKKRTTKKRASATKLYKIYDMANGGRLLKVRKDDPRYLEEDEALMEGRTPRYPHRKPSKKAKQEYAVGEVIEGSPAAGLLKSSEAQKVAATAALAAAPRVVRSVPKIIKAATQAQVGTGVLQKALGVGTVSLGATGVGLLAAAGLTSYFTTRYIMERYGKGGRQDAALQAYLRSRRELAAKLGRPLTVPELQALNAHYQQVVREIKASNF